MSRDAQRERLAKLADELEQEARVIRRLAPFEELDWDLLSGQLLVWGSNVREVVAALDAREAACHEDAEIALASHRKDVIEECAKVCETVVADNMKHDHVYSGDGDERFLYIATGARACIKFIRALSAARGEGAGS